MHSSVIFLISKKAIIKCDVCGAVTYISNRSKYLKTEVRYATDVKTNLKNFKVILRWLPTVS